VYPYNDLVQTNRNRSRDKFEYELLDTGIFNEDKYFDVFVEYAKADSEDVLIKVSVHNRGPQAAKLHVLPMLWFRNTWSDGEEGAKPSLWASKGAIVATHPKPGEYTVQCEDAPELLFTRE
jgi:hypothetical protein